MNTQEMNAQQLGTLRGEAVAAASNCLPLLLMNSEGEFRALDLPTIEEMIRCTIQKTKCQKVQNFFESAKSEARQVVDVVFLLQEFLSRQRVINILAEQKMRQAVRRKHFVRPDLLFELLSGFYLLEIKTVGEAPKGVSEKLCRKYSGAARKWGTNNKKEFLGLFVVYFHFGRHAVEPYIAFFPENQGISHPEFPVDWHVI